MEHNERSPEAVEAPDVIARFYDEHPYPRPVDDLDEQLGLIQNVERRRAEYHLLWSMRPFREELDVLVAGCGTSQAVRHALRWPEGRVVGIDVSETSLHHTEELGRRYDLENLAVHPLPIERVGELEQSFDLIVCTGVLHHLADPDGGLRALRAVLRPGGVMLMMVYAPYGRIGVSMMQEYSRRLGIGTSDEELRDLARTLAEIPRDHPLTNPLRDTPDFRSRAGLADALLNPRDRTYSVPELFDFIGRSGLAFSRWYRQAPYLPQCGAIATTPHAPRLESLPEPEQFAAMELLRGSMSRHSALLHRDDDDTAKVRVSFEGGGWWDSIPIPLPNTIQVEERLPTGAAAVLINRSHTFSDLTLPITPAEKELFAAIDGQRTVAESATEADVDGAEHQLAVRAFFQRLWRYDQIVFDASHSQSGTTAGRSRSRPTG